MFSFKHTISLWCFLSVFFVLTCGESFAQSNRYENSNNYKTAIAALDNDDLITSYDYLCKEIAVHPDNGYAYFYMSYILYGYNDLYHAFLNINKSIDYLPETDKIMMSKAYLLRARIRFQESVSDEVLEDIDYAITLTPKELDLYQIRAELFSKRGKYEESDEDYKKMLTLHPGYAIAEIGLAENDLRRGNYSQSIAQLDKLAKKYPQYSVVYALRAEAYCGLNMISEAVDNIIESLSIDNNEAAIVLMCGLADDQYHVLIEKITEKRSHDYTNSVWPFYLGFINELVGKIDLALAKYHESFELDENVLSASSLSRCYKSKSDWKHAIDYIDKVLAKNPTNYSSYHSKADIFWYAGQLDKAVDVITECIEKCPDNYLNYYRRGYFKELNNDLEGAIEDYSESITRNPSHANSRMLRGRLYRSRNYSENATLDFKKCVQFDTVPKDNSTAHFALYYLRQESEAEEFVERVLEHESVNAYYSAACFYSLTNNKEKALHYLRKSLECGYDNYNHLLRETCLKNIRNENEFKTLFEDYSKMQLLSLESQTKENPDKNISKTQKSRKPAYKEVVSYISYAYSHGIRKVDGTVNGFKVKLSYLPKSKFLIAAYQAEYFLRNGYIGISDVIGSNIVNGNIPIGNKVKFTIKIGDELLKDVYAEVVSNDHPQLVFGNEIFGSSASVSFDDNRRVIIITKKQY